MYFFVLLMLNHISCLWASAYSQPNKFPTFIFAKKKVKRISILYYLVEPLRACTWENQKYLLSVISITVLLSQLQCKRRKLTRFLTNQNLHSEFPKGAEQSILLCQFGKFPLSLFVPLTSDATSGNSLCQESGHPLI